MAFLLYAENDVPEIIYLERVFVIVGILKIKTYEMIGIYCAGKCIFWVKQIAFSVYFQ